MGDQFDSLLDVTIVYPAARRSSGISCAATCRGSIVRVQQLPIPAEFC